MAPALLARNELRAANGGFPPTVIQSRYSLVTMFPWLVANTGTGYEELRGEIIEVYSIGTGAGDSEDVIDLGTSTYKMFNISTAGWCAVKE